LRLEANVKNGKWWKGCKLPSCLINAQPLLAHHPAADDILAAQGHSTWQMIGRCPVPISLTADAHFGACLGAFFYWTKTMYRWTIPLRFIWSICSGNYG